MKTAGTSRRNATVSTVDASGGRGRRSTPKVVRTCKTLRSSKAIAGADTVTPAVEPGPVTFVWAGTVVPPEDGVELSNHSHVRPSMSIKTPTNNNTPTTTRLRVFTVTPVFVA